MMGSSGGCINILKTFIKLSGHEGKELAYTCINPYAAPGFLPFQPVEDIEPPAVASAPAHGDSGMVLKAPAANHQE